MIATQNVSPDIRIHEIVNQMIECSIEDLFHACPDLSWNQIFAAVDRLSRTGSVGLQQKGRGNYVVQVGTTNHARGTTLYGAERTSRV